MVEGGARLGTQFLAGGLVDELQLVIAPFFVGDPAAPRFAGPGQLPGTARPTRCTWPRPGRWGRWCCCATWPPHRPGPADRPGQREEAAARG